LKEIDKIRKIVELLKCDSSKVILREINAKKGVSGVIFCNDYTYPVKFSLPVLIPPKDRRKYRKLRAVYESIGVSKWRSTQSDWVRHMRVLHYKGLSELSKKLRNESSKNILFLGCGWGWEIWALERLLDKKHFFVGLDLSRKPLLVARKIAMRKKATNIFLGIGVTDILPFKDNVFDAVIAIFGPLDHTREYVKAFKEISRVTKKGGFFYFTVLNRFALDWMMKVLLSPKLYLKTLKKAKEKFVRVTIPAPIRAYRIPTHFYDIFEVRNLLDLNGFNVVKIWGIFSLLPANFKAKKFGKLDNVLSKVELLVSDKAPFRWFGRYIAILAKK